MILPTFATPKAFTHGLHPQGKKEAYWYLFFGDQLLISSDRINLPDKQLLSLKRSLYMGTYANRDVFVGEVEEQLSLSGWIWSDLRQLFGVLDEDLYSLAGQALQIIDWDRTHQHCGRCGTLTFHRENERCRECTSCKHLAYPRLAPVVMALVKKGSKILLARSPHFPERMYSVLAGFVDFGETLEQCVLREVYEEVGLRVKELRYFASQPWPFSRSLMMGFTCQWQEGEIRIDRSEIEDAGWFEASNLPQIPTHLSLARLLIDSAL